MTAPPEKGVYRGTCEHCGHERLDIRDLVRFTAHVGCPNFDWETHSVDHIRLELDFQLTEAVFT